MGARDCGTDQGLPGVHERGPGRHPYGRQERLQEVHVLHVGRRDHDRARQDGGDVPRRMVQEDQPGRLEATMWGVNAPAPRCLAGATGRVRPGQRGSGSR